MAYQSDSYGEADEERDAHRRGDEPEVLEGAAENFPAVLEHEMPDGHEAPPVRGGPEARGGCGAFSCREAVSGEAGVGCWAGSGCDAEWGGGFGGMSGVASSESTKARTSGSCARRNCCGE